MKKIASLIFVLMLFWACSPTKTVSPRNYAAHYSESHLSIERFFKIYHSSDSVSTCYYQFPSDYFSLDSSKNLNLELSYKLFDIKEPHAVLERKSYSLKPQKIDQSKAFYYINGEFALDNILPKKYTLEITVKDLLKQEVHSAFIHIDKTNAYSDQNFIVKDTRNRVITSPQMYVGDTVYISTNTNQKTLLLTHLYKEFAPALPPFAYDDDLLLNFTQKEKSDLNTSSGVFELVLNKPGIYYLKKDTLAKTGLSILVQNQSHPKFKDHEALIYPLRYITTKKEFDALTSASNKREALESFWLRIAENNKETAASLIKSYYKRCEISNLLFSSFTSGWQTDRGMVYQIYGLPTLVYRSAGGESWVYGTDQQSQSFTFSFKKMVNPLSGNDYVLDRSNMYRSSYYRAVERWRSGNAASF